MSESEDIVVNIYIYVDSPAKRRKTNLR
jgi:3-methyladenine DNA glycosylase Tag